MKPESLAVLSFLVSLIAYEFLGLLVYAAVISSSVSSGVVVTGLLTIAIFTIIGALLTGLKVYAIEKG